MSESPLRYEAAFCSNDLFVEFIKKHQIAIENLTEHQLAEAIRQAIQSGDFIRYVRQEDSAQQIVYVPWREADRLSSLYHEILNAVETKYEGESRHETALRYIKERESSNNKPSQPE
jgi:hypothetical protein